MNIVTTSSRINYSVLFHNNCVDVKDQIKIVTIKTTE